MADLTLDKRILSGPANPGYAFAYFTGALQGTTASQNLTMTGPATVTARKLIEANSSRMVSPIASLLKQNGGKLLGKRGRTRAPKRNCLRLAAHRLPPLPFC